jgi:hypothetical protein
MSFYWLKNQVFVRIKSYKSRQLIPSFLQMFCELIPSFIKCTNIICELIPSFIKWYPIFAQFLTTYSQVGDEREIEQVKLEPKDRVTLGITFSNIFKLKNYNLSLVGLTWVGTGKPCVRTFDIWLVWPMEERIVPPIPLLSVASNNIFHTLEDLLTNISTLAINMKIAMMTY